jgi:hypothetical protein
MPRRHIIHPDAGLCVTGCGGVETAHHLFLSCPVFAPLWNLIRSWVGTYSAGPSLLHDHFLQFPVIQRAVPENAAFSCSYYGYVVFGLFGMSEITGCLEQMNLRSSKW